MNDTLALFFTDDYIQAAVNPLPGKFQLLSKRGFPLYFLITQDTLTFGDYKTDYLNSDNRVKGNFYQAILNNETYKHLGYQVSFIESIKQILDEINEKYYKSLRELTHQGIPEKRKIPLRICFTDSIPDKSKQKIKSYLQNKGYQLTEGHHLCSAAHLLMQKVITGRNQIFREGSYAILEALNKDLIISFLEVLQSGEVRRQAVQIVQGFGSDPRIGALAKYAVEKANKNRNYLDDDALEKEYLHQIESARAWNKELIKNKNSRYINIKVKLSIYPNDPISITITRDKIEELTQTRSRHIGSLFENYLSPLGIQLERVLALGDSLDNEHLINEFKRFGKEKMISLGNSRVADILHGMLIDTEKMTSTATESTELQMINFVETNTLTPGDKVLLRWAPGREVSIMFEGSTSFVVVKSLKASILEGDRFQIKQFRLGDQADMGPIDRLGSKKTFSYKSGPLTFLSILKKL